jgi:hypothetical protein
MANSSVIIINAWTQRGWSSTDHMIDDTRLAEVVGREFRTLEHARRAVEARTDRRGYGTFTYELAGRTYQYDDSPAGIPGRNVQRIRELRA